MIQSWKTTNFDHLNFEQGWGRHNNASDTTLYADTYIVNYKDKLFEFYEQGRKHSSEKMMREKLQKDYPNTFSLPGETEVKKYITLLFSQTKGENRNGNPQGGINVVLWY